MPRTGPNKYQHLICLFFVFIIVIIIESLTKEKLNKCRSKELHGRYSQDLEHSHINLDLVRFSFP